MRQAKLEDTVKLLKEKLQTEDGKLSDPTSAIRAMMASLDGSISLAF